MMTRAVCRIAFSVLICLALTIPTAHAQLEEGMKLFEIYGGTYDPGPDVFDDESTFGLRFGFMMTERWAFIGSVGTVELAGTAVDGMTSVNLESDLTLVDFSVGYAFRADKRFAIAVGGGIGGAFNDFDGQLTTPTLIARFNSLSKDSFTLHAVVGPVIGLSSRVYLKPVIRARWYEARDDDETDVQSTLAVGFKW
jgi:hypothetical protein